MEREGDGSKGRETGVGVGQTEVEHHGETFPQRTQKQRNRATPKISHPGQASLPRVCLRSALLAHTRSGAQARSYTGTGAHTPCQPLLLSCLNSLLVREDCTLDCQEVLRSPTLSQPPLLTHTMCIEFGALLLSLSSTAQFRERQNPHSGPPASGSRSSGGRQR